MASFWIFEDPDAKAGSAEAVDGAIMVRDGWSWGAFFLGPLWLLWRGLWLPALVWLALLAGAIAAGLNWPETASVGVSALLLFGLWLAVEGNALRASALARQGFRLATIAVGGNRREAEQRYVRAALKDEPPPVAPRPDEIRASRPLAITHVDSSDLRQEAAPRPQNGVTPPEAAVAEAPPKRRAVPRAKAQAPETRVVPEAAPAPPPVSVTMRTPGDMPAMPRVNMPFTDLQAFAELRKLSPMNPSTARPRPPEIKDQ